MYIYKFILYNKKSNYKYKKISFFLIIIQIFFRFSLVLFFFFIFLFSSTLLLITIASNPSNSRTNSNTNSSSNSNKFNTITITLTLFLIIIRIFINNLNNLLPLKIIIISQFIIFLQISSLIIRFFFRNSWNRSNNNLRISHTRLGPPNKSSRLTSISLNRSNLQNPEIKLQPFQVKELKFLSSYEVFNVKFLSSLHFYLFSLQILGTCNVFTESKIGKNV